MRIFRHVRFKLAELSFSEVVVNTCVSHLLSKENPKFRAHICTCNKCFLFVFCTAQLSFLIRPQVILGIVFPPGILLMDFRLGDETAFHSSKGSEDARNKDEDNKSCKVKTRKQLKGCQLAAV